MGTESSKYADDSMEWEFVGREKDMETVSVLLKENQTVGIYGIRKIGKSRFLLTLFRKMSRSETTCVIQDFELDDINSASAHYQWLDALYTYTDKSSNHDEFNAAFPKGKIACCKCENCKNETACENKITVLEHAVNRTISSLKTCGTKIFLFLDSVDNLIESELKGIFFNFIEELDESCPQVKLLFCSSSEATFAHKSFSSIVLRPLQKEAITKLIYLTTESSINETDSDFNEEVSQNKASVDTDDFFTHDNEYFTPENKLYINAIAELCVGLPVAAIMAGSLLTEDEGILIPAELLEILIRSRLKNVNPDHCLLDDKVDIFLTPMQQIDSTFREYFAYLNEHVTSYTFQIDEEMVTDNRDTEKTTCDMAEHANVGTILAKVKLLSNEKQKYLYRIFKEYQTIITALRYLSLDTTGPKYMVVDCVRGSLKDAGIHVEDDVLNDSKALERATVELTIRVQYTRNFI